MSLESIANSATALTFLVIIASVVLLYRQLREVARATHAQSFLGAVNLLQNRRVRAARKRIFELDAKPFSEWTEQEIADGDEVCNSYDIVGIMTRYGVLPKQLILDNWGDSLIRLLPNCQPLIEDRRKKRTRAYWDDFEWLAGEARNFKQR